MDTMYIIKSGDLRYTKGGGSGGGRAGFSARISLKTAHKMGKWATAEKLIAERLADAQAHVEELSAAEPPVYMTAEECAEALEEARQELALWQAARLVEIKLVEV